jgi:uncharacterized membrane protein YbhN (UPF0104 family)
MPATTGEPSEDEASRTSASAAPPAPTARPWYRRWLPFGLAVALLAFTASRIDFDAFVRALAQLDYVGFTAFTLVWAALLLGADALGSYVAYRIAMPGVRWLDLYIYRGASYIPSVANFHVGQAYLTYLMSKLSKVSIGRMAGATLVSYASWMGCLTGCFALALPFTELPKIYTPVILVTGIAYLGVIHTKPAALARISFLSPLFEAGVKGHLLALAARVPHLLVLVLGTWVSFFFFGVHIPLGQALVYLPILLVATTLPLTPQGFGTRDALAAFFFEKYATDATHAERLGRLGACTTSWGIMTTIVAVLIGLVCSRFVRRRLREIGEA